MVKPTGLNDLLPGRNRYLEREEIRKFNEDPIGYALQLFREFKSEAGYQHLMAQYREDIESGN